MSNPIVSFIDALLGSRGPKIEGWKEFTSFPAYDEGQTVSWRAKRDLGEELRRRGLQVTHIHPNSSAYGEAAARNVTTIVYEPRRDEKHTIRVATSVCSEHDTFSKKIGVSKALARWDRGERVSLPARLQPQTDHDLLESYFS